MYILNLQQDTGAKVLLNLSYPWVIQYKSKFCWVSSNPSNMWKNSKVFLQGKDRDEEYNQDFVGSQFLKSPVIVRIMMTVLAEQLCKYPL